MCMSFVCMHVVCMYVCMYITLVPGALGEKKAENALELEL